MVYLYLKKRWPSDDVDLSSFGYEICHAWKNCDKLRHFVREHGVMWSFTHYNFYVSYAVFIESVLKTLEKSSLLHPVIRQSIAFHMFRKIILSFQLKRSFTFILLNINYFFLLSMSEFFWV